MGDSPKDLATDIDERQPLSQAEYIRTVLPLRQSNDLTVQPGSTINFIQAWTLLKCTEVSQDSGPSSFWRRLCSCWCSQCTVLTQLANLRKLEFDLNSSAHERVLNSCLIILTKKTLNSVARNAPLKYVTKGFAYSLSLREELAKKGSLLSLLFVLYLEDSMKDALKERLQAIQNTWKGPVPILAWLNFAGPIIWKYFGKKRKALGDTAEDAFLCFRYLFDSWVEEFLRNPRFDWYCETKLLRLLKNSDALLKECQALLKSYQETRSQ